MLIHKHASIILYDVYFISSWYCKYVLVMKWLRDSFAEGSNSKTVGCIRKHFFVFLTLLHNFIIIIHIWRVSYICGWPNTFLNGQILKEVFGHLFKYFFFLILNSATTILNNTTCTEFTYVYANVIFLQINS